MQFDVGGARIECGAIVVAREFCPCRRSGNAGQDSRSLPDDVAPAPFRLAAFEHDTDRDGSYRLDTHPTASRCLIGRPVTRFWGFMRISLPGVMAKMR